MRLPCTPALAWLSALLVPASAAAQAQVPRFQLDPVHPASPQSPFLAAEGPARPSLQGWQRLSASMIFDYARSPLTVQRSDGSRAGSPVSDALVLHAGLSVHLLQGLSADVLMPFALVHNGEDTSVGRETIAAPASSSALGDARFGLLYRGWLGSSVGFVGGVRARTPTGSRDSYMSDGRAHPEVLAGFFAQSDPVRAACTAYFDPLFASGKRGDRIAGGCGADVQVTRAGLSFGAEFLAAGLRHADDVSPRGLFELWATVRHPVGPLTAALAAGPGMGDAPGVAAVRAMAAIGWAPQQTVPQAPADRDLDGILEPQDVCPGEAGPRSSDPRRNGCPNLDSDGDGVPDHEDACPKNAGAISQDKLVTGCPDSDNDGIKDRIDICPREPAEPGSDPRTLGCPRRARLSGNQFVAQPPLREEPGPADLDALREIAFALRADSSIRQLSVEVVLSGSEADEATIDRAVDRAGRLVQQLIELGVERRRLEAVGAVSPKPSTIHFVVTDRAPRHK